MDDLQFELEAFCKAARGQAESEFARSERPEFGRMWSALEARESVELEDGDPELFEWIAAARAEAQADLDLSSRRAVPPMAVAQAVIETTPRRVAVSWWFGWAAAAVLLFVAGNWALRATQNTPEAVHQAERDAEPRDAGGEAIERPVVVEKSAPSASPEFVPSIEAVDLEPSEEMPKPVAERKSKRKPSTRERLRALDAEAQALWRAGDLDGAQAVFEQIVGKGGKSSLADVAYGDLLTLARQRGDHAREAELWRAYLRRFPKGRHADDASAGLCRRAQGDAAATCWQSYVDDFPKGTHRVTANKVLAAAKGDAP